VLDNGLTLIIQEDHSAPLANVVGYYKVGSRDEKRGKTGFAHLFEHLMFNGTENHDGDYFAAVTDVGGTLNGDTWYDRTRYFQTIPNTALDRILWLESERMGHLLGAVTQEKLDTQRGVVQNEKRRRENAPYAMVSQRGYEGLFPQGHPYRWDVIGSMEDLEAATLEDVHSWFKEFYGAANTIIVVAGDVDSVSVLADVQLYFGDIPAGPPVTRLDDFVPVRMSSSYEEMEDRAPSRQLSRLWAAPGRDQQVNAHLVLATRILGGDQSSRLYKALVKDTQLAVKVEFRVDQHDLASVPQLTISLSQDADRQEVERIVSEEMRKFRQDGPTSKETELAKTAMASVIIKGLDGLGTRAFLLAESEIFLGSPDAYRVENAWIDDATREDLQLAAQKWLGDGFHQMFVTPYGDQKAASEGADRTAMPGVDHYPDAKSPKISDHTLSNGIKVRFVKRDGVPAVTLAARFANGSAAGADKGNVAVVDMTLGLMKKGAGKRTADEVLDELSRTGSNIRYSVNMDNTLFYMSTLSSKFSDAVDIFADVLRRPAFPGEELDLLREAKLADLALQKSNPGIMGGRFRESVLYGPDHPYGYQPVDEQGIKSISTEDIREYHSTWFRPEFMTLYAVGGIEEKDLIAALENGFGDWKVKRDLPRVAKTDRAPINSAARVILFDAPGASQSNIYSAMQINVPFGADHEAFELANKIYGGTFLSRINANIRQDKGWSYGVSSYITGETGTRLWGMFAQVQTDKTAASISELLSELHDIKDAKPFTVEELEAVRNETVRRLPGVASSSWGILSYMVALGRYGHPDNRLEMRQQTFEALELSELTDAFTKHVSADNLVWLISGDLAKIEEEVRALNFGIVEVWDSSGNKLR